MKKVERIDTMELEKYKNKWKKTTCMLMSGPT